MTKYYPTKKYVKCKSIWALYKKEECLCIGTFEEIEKKLGYKRDTLHYYTSNAYKKMKNRYVYMVLVEKVKGEPLDYRKYHRLEWKNEHRKNK